MTTRDFVEAPIGLKRAHALFRKLTGRNVSLITFRRYCSRGVLLPNTGGERLRLASLKMAGVITTTEAAVNHFVAGLLEHGIRF